MKIVAEVIIRDSKYTIEDDGCNSAEEVKRVIAELENAEVHATTEVKH